MNVVFLLITLTTLLQNPVTDNSVRVLKFADLEPRLHQHDGNTWVVNFWATWCAPCVKELPYFQKIAKEYSSKNVKVLLVSLDSFKQLDSRVVPFLKQKGIGQEVILLNDPNANAWIDKVDPQWSGALPATLIYNSRYRQFYEREFTHKELREAVEQAMKHNQ